MIKFDQEKVNFANSDRIESNDLQFLTFRHSAQNNTGRSVFSQKIQIYKSLEKGLREQQDEPIRNFKKSPNLRSIRSQQKYSLAKPFSQTKKQAIQQNSNNEQNNLQLGINQYQFRNQLLRKKIQKLVKNIKNQQKKQTSLEKDLTEIQKQIEDDEAEIQNQFCEIKELQTINDENQLYLDKLVNNLEEFEKKNDNLQSLVDKIQDSLENVGKTSRQQEAKSKMAQKLKQGLVKLESLRNEVTARCIKMESEIQKMKEFLDQTENLDSSIRDTTYTRQPENSSHFTC